ncbi:hypothetical protein SpCBS45565_g07712 [Spizellomyces sp. 'palustris']|nr:hypothetical protein SpCBS45565_g07712 [Spizellomyces sp. 'palustris']
MDDLGDLAWKSAGLATKPSARSNTPLSQLSASQSGSSTPQNRTPPSFSPSSTPRMAAATSPFIPPSSGQYHSGPSPRMVGGVPGMGTSGLKPAAPSNSRSASPVPPAGIRPDDAFGNLVSFGSGAKPSMANVSLEQQRRAQEQQRQLQAAAGGVSNFQLPHQRSFTPPVPGGQSMKGQNTPNPSTAAFLDALGSALPTGSGRSSGANTPSGHKTYAGVPTKNDFSDLFGDTLNKPSSPTAVPAQKSTGMPSMKAGLTNAQPQQQHIASMNLQSGNGNGQWDLDFLARGPSSSPANVIAGDDPFDLAYLSQPVSTGPTSKYVTEDDNPLGLLAHPVSAMAKPVRKPAPVSEAPSPPPVQARPLSPPLSTPSIDNTSLDFGIAQIMDMGFDDQAAKAALDATGNNVSAAIDMLVQNREAEQQLKRGSPTRQQGLPSQSGEGRPNAHRVTKFRDDYEDESSDSDYPGSRRRTQADHGRAPSAGSDRAGLTQEKLVQTATAIGATVLSNAKSMLAFSKKKISEAVERAQLERENAAIGRSRKESFGRDGDESDYYAAREREGHQRFRDESDEEDDLQRHSPYQRGADVPLSRFRDDSSDEENVPKSRPQPAKSASPATTFFQQHPPSSSTPPRPATPQPVFQNPPPRQPTPPPAVVATQQQLSESDMHKTKGNEFFKQGQFADAETSYSAAINCLPARHLNLVALYNNRAAARLKTGNYRDAVEDCNQVHEFDKKDLKALLRRATAWEALERWGSAREDYRMVMAIDSSVKAASQGLARANKALQPPEVATKSTPPPAVSTASKPQRSTFADMAGFEGSSKPMDPYVANAVNTAVQKLREQNQQSEDEEAMKLALKDQIDDQINRWRRGKEDNLRALLSSLDLVLWPELQWKTINLSELITPQQVKVKYMRAVGRVHPDKLNQDSSVEHRLVANAVFSTLNKGWDAFKAQNGIN